MEYHSGRIRPDACDQPHCHGDDRPDCPIIDRLADWEETAGKVTAQLRGLQGKEIDSLRKTTAAVTDSIKVLREEISGKRTEKQGISRPQQVTVLNAVQQAQQGAGVDPYPGLRPRGA